jgi:uncharacterized membrane protein (DUF485 family)
VLAQTAPNLLGTRVHKGINLGYVLMVGLFVLVWVLVFGYARIANGRWDRWARS